MSESGTADEAPTQTIGCADLGGFTALSQQLDSASLAGVVRYSDTGRLAGLSRNRSRIRKSDRLVILATTG